MAPEQGLRRLDVLPFGKSLAPPAVVLGDRVELRQVECDSSYFYRHPNMFLRFPFPVAISIQLLNAERARRFTRLTSVSR